MKSLESEMQIALFDWAKLQEKKYPELKLLHHIPNGGKRNITTAVRLKREGVKAGVPDVFLPVARKGYHGLYIELKAGKGKVTINQDFWIDELREQKYFVDVCWDWEVAKSLILKYLEVNEI